MCVICFYRRGVKELLLRKIKEECLRTYLFTYSHVYDSISLPKLASMYSLEYSQVHSIVAKMIINQEFMVSYRPQWTSLRTKYEVCSFAQNRVLSSILLELSDCFSL
jgi:hypothetical protein